MKSSNKLKYRKILFLHQQGVVLIPILNSLFNSNISNYILSKKFCIKDLSSQTTINDGYINTALRVLRSCNLLEYFNNNTEIKSKYKAKKELIILFNYKNKINLLTKLIPYHINFDSLTQKQFEEYSEILNSCYDFIRNIKEQKIFSDRMYHRFAGIIIAPILTNLKFYNYLHYNNKEDFSIKNLNNQLSNSIETFFLLSKIINLNNENYSITNKGFYYFKCAPAYGVTCSYLKMFNRINELFFKNCNFIWEKDDANHEMHVNRTMNVWGSGHAHKTYFKYIDQIILNIFNQKIEKQPKGIIDIGCGDGAFLEHVYNIIMDRTNRSKYLDTFPLYIIGVDINIAARKLTRRRLNKANISNIVINGNISNPYEINKELNNNFNFHLNDFLNTRTFLDHNRIYEEPKELRKVNIDTSGSFCYKGKFIDKKYLINNLIEHLSNWKKYVEKHGLIILELHTIDPYLTMINRGKTLACAYDTTHGFSDQYLVEYDFYIYCCKKAGLKLKDNFLFPNEKIPTVSVGYFK